MNNFIRIMSLDETSIHRTVFSNARNEAGINLVYDPELNQDHFQVFIHNLLPYREVASHLFKTFEEARAFAARTFSIDWEMHSWDFTLRRKCGSSEDGGSCGTGGGCGSGNCSSGGGCGTKEGSSSSGCSACQIEQD